ncbi:MAG: hypothetical protein AB7U26_07375 [Sulfuricurvum sp.]
MTSKERLLEAVIADAKTKGAPIIGWHTTPAGKVSVEFKNTLPQYFLGPVTAADSLIHQYNLVARYRYLYNAPKRSLRQRANTQPADPQKRESPFDKALHECSEVIRLDNAEFTPTEKNRTYQAMHKALADDSLSQSGFFALRHEMIDHYTGLLLVETEPPTREKLRKLVRFFEKMHFYDISDLY